MEKQEKKIESLIKRLKVKKNSAIAQKPVPKTLSPKFILTDTLYTLILDIFSLIENRENILLIGEAGVGKNSLIDFINSLRGLDSIRYSFNQEILAEEIIGSYSISNFDKQIRWQDGSFVRSLKMDIPFIADELNLAPYQLLQSFISFFENRYFELSSHENELLFRREKFTFFATQNPAEGYSGRNKLPQDIEKHFSVIYISEYNSEELLLILRTVFTIPIFFLQRLVEFHQQVNTLIKQRFFLSHNTHNFIFNLRDLKRFCKRISSYVQFNERDQYTQNEDSFWSFINEHRYFIQIYMDLEDIYATRFPEGEDREKISRLIYEYFPFQAMEDLESVQIINDKDYLQLGRAILYFPQRSESAHAQGQRNVNSDHPDNNLGFDLQDKIRQYPLCRQSAVYLEKMSAALVNGENLFLDGEPSAEIKTYIFWLSYLFRLPLREIIFNRNSTVNDLLGSLKPVDGNIRWVDGPLSQALKEGGIIIFKGVEQAGGELIEKLNMLTDDAKRIYLPPESGQSDPLFLKDNCRIIVVNEQEDKFKKRQVSKAFRNRFVNIFVPAYNQLDQLQEKAYNIFSNSLSVEETNLIKLMSSFHYWLQSSAEKMHIGAENNFPYVIHWMQLYKVLLYLWTEDEKSSIQDSIQQAVRIYYINMIRHPKDRELVHKQLEKMLKDPDLDIHLDLPKPIQNSQPSYDIKQKYFKKGRIDLPPKDSVAKRKRYHSARYRSRGPKRKKGLDIDTPETGGNIKEGKHAFYGKDTRGNRGFGEAGGGGGQLAYRSEDLLQSVREKRNPLWPYDLGLSFNDFQDYLFRQIPFLKDEMDNFFHTNDFMQLEHTDRGLHVDIKRILDSKHDQKKIFVKKENDPEKKKDIEIIFLLQKGRRTFNFEFAFDSMLSLASTLAILKEYSFLLHLVSYGNVSSSAYRLKLDHRIYFHGELNRDKVFEDMYNIIMQDWDMRNIHDVNILTKINNLYQKKDSVKILFWLSDFRGEYSMKNDAHYLKQREFVDLVEGVQNFALRNIEFVPVGIGPRSLVDDLSSNFVKIDSDHIDTLPLYFTKEMLRRISNIVALR